MPASSSIIDDAIIINCVFLIVSHFDIRLTGLEAELNLSRGMEM